jgi:hypothetical protein
MVQINLMTRWAVVSGGHDPEERLLAAHYEIRGYGDGTLRSRPISLVPYGTDGVFAVEGLGARRVLHVSFPDPGPVVHPDPNLTKAIPIASTWAVLNTRINPEGKGSTYRFEYVDDATCQEDIDDLGPGHCFDRAMSTTEASLALGTTPSFAPPLFRLSMASAQVGCLEPENPPQVSCLTPETVYHFRAVAKNPDGENTGPESSFETRISPEILDTWSTNVGVDSAFVHAEVDPVGIPASGRFEYVEEAAYLKDLAELGPGHGFDHAASSDPIDFGSGEGPTVRGVQLHSLKPGTAYRYRVVVENSFRSAVGPERSFKTFLSPSGPKSCPNDSFRTGLSAHLPDCRVYEMVSPVDKEGGEIAVNSIHSGVPAEHNQSAAEVPAGGRGLTYSSNRAFGDSISAPFTSQYMASRHLAGDPEEGWRSHGISPRREGRNFLVGLGPGLDTQYKAFSEDLRYGWLRSDSEPPLESEPPLPIPGFANLYRRENESETYEAICPVEPPKEEREAYVPEPQGFSADGGTTVFRANDKLTTNASSKKGIYQLYGCAEGNLRLISMLPSGNASGNNSSAGTRLGTRGDHREDSLHNAVSADASPGPLQVAALRPRRVATRLETAGWRLERLLSDNGNEFKGEFTATAEDLGARHTRIHAGRPQTNGNVEALHRTILDECWRPAFARYMQPRLSGLKRQLDTYLRFYNYDRVHHGRLTGGQIAADIVYGAARWRSDEPEVSTSWSLSSLRRGRKALANAKRRPAQYGRRS